MASLFATTRTGTHRPMPFAVRVMGTFVLVLGILSGCTTRLRALPVDPAVDYAAHVDHRGLVIDEMPGALPAILVPAGWQSWSGGPRYLLQAHDKTIAALWFPRAGRMIVRQTADPGSPLIGEVDAAWSEGAIRLTFKPADGSEFQTSEFDRIDGRVATAALSSQAQSNLDVRGVYRADLKDASGAPAGWLRVQISPYQGASRIYDGVVPPALNGPLTTAAIAMIDSDVNYIEDRAVNVYVGN
ncbi:MAG TPA: hypothetical protein VL403_05585 [Candidatus Kryptonia bacterium]|nr:hypothetical protein [Candidatus Kryptonia bacterium]